MIKQTFIGIVAVLTTISATAQPITAGQHTRVETIYGPIEGYQDGSIYTFKGIRYADDVTAVHNMAEIVNGKSSNSQFIDLSGRRVTTPQHKGVYIRNGRKIYYK